jgi:hypothetical protein
MTDAPETPQLIPTPRPGCILLALPILLTIVVGTGYATLFGLGSIGGSARGERITMNVTTCSEAQALIAHRVTAMGLGDPQWEKKGSQWALTVTLPGRDPKVDRQIPSVLQRQGTFNVYAGDHADPSAVLLDRSHVTSTTFTLREMANPLIEVLLNKEGRKTLVDYMTKHPTKTLSVWLDNERILQRSNTPLIEGHVVELRSHDEDGKVNLQRAADWDIVLTHGPLPCATAITAPPLQ